MNKAIPRIVQLGFLFGLCILALSATLPYRNIQLLQNNEHWVNHTLEVLQAVNDLRIAVTDAESGQRGFLLTQNPAYLEPYESARQKISQLLNALTSLTVDNQSQQHALNQLNELIASKFNELQTTIDLQNQSKRDEALDLVATNLGDNLMHKIRHLLNDFQVAEKKLLGERVMDAQSRFQKTVYNFLLATFLNLLLFGALYAFIIRNLKMRRAAEISLQQNANLLTSVVNNMSEGLYVMDTKGKVLFYNPVLIEIYGKKIAEFGPGDWQREYQISNMNGDPFKFEDFPAIAILAGQSEAMAEMVIRLLDSNETKFIKVSARPLKDESGNLEGVVCISSDISSQKRAELKLRFAIHQAESANKAKSNFVANMSHEIRTPMNAVLGIAQLLHKTELSKEQKKYLDMILLSGKSLMNILNDILDFSKIEADKMELTQQQFHLNDVVHALSTIMSMAAANKDIELIIDSRFTNPPLLLGDSHRLHQILVNLISNAIKFTDSGEVAVIVACQEWNADQMTIRFIVKDTGIGMTQAQQNRLFLPFTQADSSTTRQYGGTGLGLTIAQRLTKLMGGGLEVKSSVGEGSEFAVIIPFKLSPNLGHSHEVQSSLGTFRLLVIDDNETVRSSIANHLSMWHCSADLAASADEGLVFLHQAKSSENTYDAILLDWRIQGGDAMALIKEICKASPDKTPIVLMVSMYDRDHISEKELLNEGGHPISFLFKPITSSNLFDTLNEFFGSQQKRLDLTDKNDSDSRPLTDIRILLVEDNEFNQIVARDFLEQAGAFVEVVENGKLAIDALDKNLKNYDAVLMDVQMPVMDGFTATRIIRQAGINIPIIAMTAGVTQFERGACIESGMNDLIAKPIEVEKMLATIILHTLGRELDFQNDISITTTESIENKIFDITNLVKMGGNIPGHLQKIVTLIENLVKNSRASFDAAKVAADQGIYDEVANILHKLRGTLGVVGAKNFAENALVLEELIRNNATESDIKQALHSLEEHISLTLAAATEWARKSVM